MPMFKNLLIDLFFLFWQFFFLINIHLILILLWSFEFQTFAILVPMDLDVKMKAVMMGAVFLIVSYSTW